MANKNALYDELGWGLEEWVKNRIKIVNVPYVEHVLGCLLVKNTFLTPHKRDSGVAGIGWWKESVDIDIN
jgi:hypothetical protein